MKRGRERGRVEGKKGESIERMATCGPHCTTRIIASGLHCTNAELKGEKEKRKRED